MDIPDFALTSDMFDALLLVTRIENEAMVNALREVLVQGEKMSPTAVKYGIKRQQLHVRLKHIQEQVKPAMDKYAFLATTQLKQKVPRS